MSTVTVINSYPWLFRALRLDRIIAERVRVFIMTVSFWIVLFSGAAEIISSFFKVSALNGYDDLLLGVSFVSGAVALLFWLVEFFYRSNLVPAFVLEREGIQYTFSVETSRLLMNAEPSVLARDAIESLPIFQSFARLPLTDLLLVRLGIPREAFEIFLNAHAGGVSVLASEFFTKVCDRCDKERTQGIWVSDILAVLMDCDALWNKFLFDAKVTREDFVAAALWVEYQFSEETKRKRWWDRSQLGQISGLGKDLGFGYTYHLDMYSHEVWPGAMKYARETRRREIEALEQALSRSYEANVMLVGEEGSGKHAVLEGLSQKILEGSAPATLEFKRMVMLDYSSITAATKTKGDFEATMIKLLEEAVAAGNIILIIENFEGFLSSIASLGTDGLALLEPYAATARLQIIGLSDPTAYHRDLEPDGKVTKLFEKVDIEQPDANRLLMMVEDAALIIESRARKVFTFQAIKKSVALADRFIQDGAMPEKAIDLLESAASSVAVSKILIYPEDIESVVEKKTHIPTSKAESEERDKLLNMEQLLHERMIDQEEAIRSVSDALRRARSGLKGNNRPIGTFLFIGPTGVGKTETAKALAQVYFGDEEAMFRFDMSEYSQGDGVEKLIGSRDSKIPGVLASRLRERPFSLLLFDEFEKATREVHNIFLQILDEGFFSDGAGKRVSARETMIIMTSNAGANLIIELLRVQKDSAVIKQSIIDEIRTKNIFTPELLNRFDEIVLFKPLPKEELVKVAMLMLKGLTKKLAEQEIIFVPSEELAARVVEIGYDPIFGARPMRRAISDRVEQVIAKKILGGELKRGDTFQFASEDIKNL
ncbi:MAG: ATP-dependent Clp protease ATP-binding subunit [Patescibacteria group bacterium]